MYKIGFRPLLHLFSSLFLASVLLSCGGGGGKADITPPTVIATDPIILATNVPLSTQIKVTFSEPVDPDTVTDATFFVSTNRGNIPGGITLSGNTAIFTPDDDLLPGTLYTATASAAVTDLAGNAMIGAFAWVFTTISSKDTTPPTIFSKSPDAGEIGVAVNTPIKVIFSEAINPNSVNKNSFQVTEVGAFQPLSGSYDVNDSTAIFRPSFNLSPNKSFIVLVSLGIKDLAGNTLGTDTQWKFTTGDDTAPKVTFTAPYNGDPWTALNTDIGVVFEGKIDETIINDSTLTLTDGVNSVPVTKKTAVNNIAVFTPTVNLEASTTYTATLNHLNIQNSNGTTMKEDYTWNFTTCQNPCFPRFAYTANSGDDTISIYTMNASTGQLRHNGYALAGMNPCSVTLNPANTFLYAANCGSDNVSAYAINPQNGNLTEIADPPFTVGDEPSSIAIDPFGRFLYAANQGSTSNNISAFTIDPGSGALTQIAGSPFQTGLKPSSIIIDPTGRFLYATNLTSNNISAFTINPVSGVLTETAGSPYTAGVTPISLTIDRSGKFLYTANQNSNSISSFAIQDDSAAPNPGSLTPVDTYPILPAGTAHKPHDVTIDPSGNYLYTANSDSNSVSAFTIDLNSGALTQIDGDPSFSGIQNFPSGTNPNSIKVDPSGQFVYAT
ncbi:MAG TPA: Ig-like domain-containing protein, partial [Nitrospiria bacterium]|nr:Ig-like domain-containing protein [Nitrospiria bacterium]